MSYIKINADQFHCDADENSVITLSIAEGDDADPEKYVIFQRDDSDGYWFEMFDISLSGESGIDKIVFSNSILVVLSNKVAAKFEFDGVRINISKSKLDDAFICFNKIFGGTDCEILRLDIQSL
jgi:hypothetical protein